MSGDGIDRPAQEADVVVFGQIARDLVLVVDEVPVPAGRPVLAGVVGEDETG